MSSKPGAVGNDMRTALNGGQDHRGPISDRYKGDPRNAIPGYPHHPDNSQSVSDWTKHHMKGAREQAKEKRDNAK